MFMLKYELISKSVLCFQTIFRGVIIMIYLDNSATTQPDPSVLKSFQRVATDYFANPSSLHSLGVQSANLLDTARKQIAKKLSVEKQEIVFTSGGTEGNNLAIKGTALKHQNRGKHIITTQIEHPSVYDVCESLEELGFEITYLSVDSNGVISLEELKRAIREDTILITIMHVNNELGSIQPIHQIGEIAKDYPKLYFHVDDVQGFGKVPLDLKNSGIDLYTLSGHKINGLNGTGLLYVNEKVSLAPLFHGGKQERSLRSGTEDLAGAVSLARAIRLIKDKEQTLMSDLVEMKDYLREGLGRIGSVVINTPVDSAPHILNVSVPDLKPEIIINILGEQGIYISTKSACSSKRSNESSVLIACGLGFSRASSALRISLSYENNTQELTRFLEVFEHAIKQLKTVWE